MKSGKILTWEVVIYYVDHLLFMRRAIYTHWRIHGGRQGRPPLDPISFIFMDFQQKPCQIIVFLPKFQGLGNPGSATELLSLFE